MKKILKLILLFIVISLIAITSLALSKNSNYKTNTSDIVTTVDKIKSASLKKEEISLNSSELNSLLGMVVNNNNNYPVDIKGIYTEIDNNKITFFLPFSYKNMDFIISSKGTISLDKDKVIYNVEYIKIGNLKIPFTILSKIFKDNLTSQVLIKDKKILINKNLIPVSLTSLTITDDKLKIKIDDIKTISINTLKEIASLPSTKETNNIKTNDTNLNETNKNEIVKNSEVNNSTTTNNTEKTSALVQVRSELNTALGLTNSANSKSIILNMQSTINKMINNPGYNYANDAAQVKEAYSKLPLEEKNNVKKAIFSSVKPSTISIIRNAFGL